MTSTLALLTRFWSAEDGAILRLLAYDAPGAEITVLAEQQVLSAPFQINLDYAPQSLGIDAPETASEYDPQFHDIEYIWSVEKVGDSSYATSTYSAVSDLPTHMKVKGTKYGKRICHVIGIGDVVAGETNTFRFTCTAINLATGASETSAVLERTIAHPDDFFSADETFVVRKTSATNHPSTNNSYYSDVFLAINAIGDSSLTKARIVCERGQSYGGRWRNLDNATGTAILYDVWGSSGTADVDATFAGTMSLEGIGANYASFQMSGFKLTYDGSEDGRGFTWNGSNAVENKVFTVSDVTLDGVTMLGQRVSGELNGWLAFSNIEHSGCKSVGSFLSGGKSTSYIGMEMHHLLTQGADNIEARIENSLDGGGGFGLRQEGGSELFYISQCSFFQKQGWVIQGPGIATSQPWLRLEDVENTRRIVIDRCMSETGYEAIKPEFSSSNSNVLIDKCFFIGQSDTYDFLRLNCPMTVRNCVFVRPPSKNVEHSFDSFIGGDVPVGGLHKVYNCTFINLSHTASGAPIHAETTRVILANNVNHQPNLDTPISAGAFSLTEIMTPQYPGYFTAKDGETPLYNVLGATGENAFTVGETVTGQTSGVSKVYVGSRNPGRFQEGFSWTFEMDVVNDRLDEAAGFERFTAGETLDGSVAGVGVATVETSGAFGQDFDSTIYGISTIHRTVTATHYIDYDAETAAFTEGETLTGGTSSATGTICQVFDDGTTGRIYLRDITGTFQNNETITDGEGGSATANGAAVSAGTGALWVPTSAIAVESGTWADKPNTANGYDFFGNASPNSQGAAKVV